MKPKVWHACVLCDRHCRDIHELDHRGRPKRIGSQHVGTQVLTLIHLDGSISDHSLCGECEISPEHLPEIWERQAMEYVNVAPAHISREHLDSFAANVPLGILAIQEITEVGQR